MNRPIRVLYLGGEGRTRVGETLSDDETFDVTVERPESARSTLRTNPETIDCALIEHADGLDAVALYRQLKADLGARTPPSVIYAEDDNAAVRALNAGIDRYVLTDGPESIERLKERIRTVTELARERSGGADWRLQRRHDRLETYRSVVSHDLRTPLNVAQGYLEFVRRDEAGDREELLDEIEDALDRLEKYLVDLGTLEAQGKPVEETERVEMETVAKEAWDAVSTGDAAISIEANGIVTADRDRLFGALRNVYRNAIEHGSESVTVTVGSLEDGFYVEDDGDGPQVGGYDDLLEPGFSTTDGATGLGLAIVEQIATAHRWNVSASEGADGGVRITFEGLERPSKAEADTAADKR